MSCLYSTDIGFLPYFYKTNCFYLQIVIAEVSPQTTKMEWRVPVVNALIHRIALSYKLKVFCSNVPALNNKYWSDDLHLSDDGLRLFMRSLEDFLSTVLCKNPIPPQFFHQQNDVPAGE